MVGTEIIRLIIDIALPAATAVAGYFTGRRKRDNDFLSELQASIDMLSAKNREHMDEVIKLRSQIVTLREENLELTKAQERILKENAALQEEIRCLREENAKQSRLIEDLQHQLAGVRTITKVKQQ